MKIENWDDDKILFSDGSSITYDHRSDCCEYNWADFSVLDIFYHGEEFDDYCLEFVNYGFVLNMSGLPYAKRRIFIPFYSSQNGYYSTDCDLIVHGKQDVKIVSNDGFLMPDCFKEPDWDDLEEEYRRGVYCTACCETRIFLNEAYAKTWLEDHVTKEHPNDKIEVDEIRGKKHGRTIGFVIHVERGVNERSK